MSKPFDPTTTDGRPVEIVRTDLKGIRPILGLVTSGGEQLAHTWRADGKFSNAGSSMDLINVPQEHEGWVNVYPRTRASQYSARLSHAHRSKEVADISNAEGRIACVHIKFKEGEGL